MNFEGDIIQPTVIILLYVVAIVFVQHDPVPTCPSFCDNHRNELAVVHSEASFFLATMPGPGMMDRLLRLSHH